MFIVKDSGNPSMSGTSTLTVIIGDENDNKMQPGQKEIMVYNYMVSNELKIICKYGLWPDIRPWCLAGYSLSYIRQNTGNRLTGYQIHP